MKLTDFWGRIVFFLVRFHAPSIIRASLKRQELLKEINHGIFETGAEKSCLDRRW
jgi:hypothetical protein